MQENLEIFQLTLDHKLDYFSDLWKCHKRDLETGHWTNMTLVGVEPGGRLRSVKVHQAVFLPVCQVLSSAAADLYQEDLMVILPDTPVEVILTLVKIIYEGGSTETEVEKVIEFLKLMKNIGLPLTSLSRVIRPWRKFDDVIILAGIPSPADRARG